MEIWWLNVKLDDKTNFQEGHTDKLNCSVCPCSRIGCYVTVFQNISNLRDVFYKEMSVVRHILLHHSHTYNEVYDGAKTAMTTRTTDFYQI